VAGKEPLAKASTVYAHVATSGSAAAGDAERGATNVPPSRTAASAGVCRTTPCSTAGLRTRAELRLAIVVWIEQTYHRSRRQDTLGRLSPSTPAARPDAARCFVERVGVDAGVVALAGSGFWVGTPAHAKCWPRTARSATCAHTAYVHVPEENR
jgi:hypothetical protein